MDKFDNQRPLYLQLKEIIEEAILMDVLKPDEVVPSIRSLAKDYKLNPITVSNAIDVLVESGILYKKIGIGMFVCPEAKQKICSQQTDNFQNKELKIAIEKAKMLGIAKEAVTEIISNIYGGKND